MGYEKLASKVGRRPATNHVACGGLGPVRLVSTPLAYALPERRGKSFPLTVAGASKREGGW